VSTTWKFSTIPAGLERNCDLYLYPELGCSSMVEELDTFNGEEQLGEYVIYLRRHHPEWLESDAVPVSWSVASDQDRGVFQCAPFAPARDALSARFQCRHSFLACFTWPVSRATGELLDWFSLPVKMTRRFPAFSRALGWKPSPMQPYCPLRSILDSRTGEYPAGTREAIRLETGEGRGRPGECEAIEAQMLRALGVAG
jgi:hypothetical protein